MPAFLTEILKIGGVGALSVATMYLLYSQLMKMKIFSRMTRGQTFALMMTMTILIFGSVTISLISYGSVKLDALISNKSSNVQNSEGVTIQQ